MQQLTNQHTVHLNLDTRYVQNKYFFSAKTWFKNDWAIFLNQKFYFHYLV